MSAAAALVLVVAFGFFTQGWIGGGDAKLAAATALWFGFDHLLDYLIYASLFGGVLTLLLLQFRMLPLPACWRARLDPAAARQRRRRTLRHRARRRGAVVYPAYRLDDAARHLIVRTRAKRAVAATQY